MDNIVDLEDFDDDEFDNSSWGGQSNQDNISEQPMSARNHEEDEEEQREVRNNDYVPHESEEMDPMMFGHVDHNESFGDFETEEHFEDDYDHVHSLQQQEVAPQIV